MPRCVMIGPNSGATLTSNDYEVLVIANGQTVFLRVDMRQRVVMLGDQDGPYVTVDFRQHPSPRVGVRGNGGDPQAIVIKAFEAFTKAFRESYENDPQGGAGRMDVEGLAQNLTLDELLTKLDGKDKGRNDDGA